MGANLTTTSHAAKRWMGQPVCVVLKDGNCCVGWITGVDREEITLSGSMIQGKSKAKVSGYMPNGIFAPGAWDFDPMDLYGGAQAGQAAPAAAGAGSGVGTGFSSFMGFMRKTWPDIQFGIGMVQQILPLMKGLKL